MNFIKPFVTDSPTRIKSLISEIGISTMASIICADTKQQPYSSFLPVDFILSDDDQQIGEVLFHIANNNQQFYPLKQITKTIIELRSQDLYISPSWFKNRNRAPTNVHIAIQCYGHPLIVKNEEQKSNYIKYQVSSREQQNKGTWSVNELDENGYYSRLQAISVFSINIKSAILVFVCYKMNQLTILSLFYLNSDLIHTSHGFQKQS